MLCAAETQIQETMMEKENGDKEIYLCAYFRLLLKTKQYPTFIVAAFVYLYE